MILLLLLLIIIIIKMIIIIIIIKHTCINHNDNALLRGRADLPNIRRAGQLRRLPRRRVSPGRVLRAHGDDHRHRLLYFLFHSVNPYAEKSSVHFHG